MPFVAPKTMMDFFHKSTGVWFTQRTVHHFDRAAADQSGESKLFVQSVEPGDAAIQQVCECQGLESAIAAGGASFLWQVHPSPSEPNPDQAAILVDVPDDESGRSGKLFRSQGYVEKIPVISRYWFGQDGILTIDTDYEQNQGRSAAGLLLMIFGCVSVPFE